MQRPYQTDLEKSPVVDLSYNFKSKAKPEPVPNPSQAVNHCLRNKGSRTTQLDVTSRMSNLVVNDQRTKFNPISPNSKHYIKDIVQP